MQTAFKDENLDTTWGLIGLFAVLLGALIALANRRRHRSRLARELRRLNAIRDRSQDDPVTALRELEEFRQEVHDKLESGRLDDGHYGALSLRISAISKRLLFQIVNPMKDKLSTSYQGLLGAAFEDGIVNEAEARALLEGLSRERRLSAAERKDLVGLFRQWAAPRRLHVIPQVED